MIPGRDKAPKPTAEEVAAARDAAFAAVHEWLRLATAAGQSMLQIMKELNGMIRS